MQCSSHIESRFSVSSMTPRGCELETLCSARWARERSAQVEQGKAGENMEGFAGKVAVVTGAGSGIGQALALELARAGAKLAVSDVDMDGLSLTEERLRYTGASV